MNKKNLVIIALIAIIGVMVASYAAFSTNLNINGTASIDSNWNVKITDITVESSTGEAKKTFEPVVLETQIAATFGTTLYLPGDTMTYKITISNLGSIDAKLDSIEMSDQKNSAITFTAYGLEIGDVLPVENTHTYYVTVTYNSDVTQQPSTEDLESTLTIKLNYVQNV